MVQKGRNIYANTNKHEAGTAAHTDKPDGTYNMKFLKNFVVNISWRLNHNLSNNKKIP